MYNVGLLFLHVLRGTMDMPHFDPSIMTLNILTTAPTKPSKNHWQKSPEWLILDSVPLC